MPVPCSLAPARPWPHGHYPIPGPPALPSPDHCAVTDPTGGDGGARSLAASSVLSPRSSRTSPLHLLEEAGGCIPTYTYVSDSQGHSRGWANRRWSLWGGDGKVQEQRHTEGWPSRKECRRCSHSDPAPQRNKGPTETPFSHVVLKFPAVWEEERDGHTPRCSDTVAENHRVPEAGACVGRGESPSSVAWKDLWPFGGDTRKQ